MKGIWTRTTALLVAVSVQWACSNPKAANAANFTKAVDAYLISMEDVCVGATRYPNQDNSFEEKLATIGFLAPTGRVDSIMGIVRARYYDLTPTGREHFTPGRGFCYGTPKVSRIVNFTEPSSMGPYTVSQVQYEWVIEAVPTWFQNEIFQDLSFYPRGPRSDRATLILTANGWSHERLFNR